MTSTKRNLVSSCNLLILVSLHFSKNLNNMNRLSIFHAAPSQLLWIHLAYFSCATDQCYRLLDSRRWNRVDCWILMGRGSIILGDNWLPTQLHWIEVGEMEPIVGHRRYFLCSADVMELATTWSNPTLQLCCHGWGMNIGTFHPVCRIRTRVPRKMTMSFYAARTLMVAMSVFIKHSSSHSK